MFGRRNATSISESLSKSRPVKYSLAPQAPAEENLPSPEEALESLGATPSPKSVDVIAEAIPIEPDSPVLDGIFGSQDTAMPSEEAPPESDRQSPPESARQSPPESGRQARAVAGDHLSEIKDIVAPELLDRIDLEAANHLPREDLVHEIRPLVSEVLIEKQITLNSAEQAKLETMILDEMRGLGPIEPLLKDESITDILVNGPEQVYVERQGKLVLTDVKFRNDQHVMNIASRIVTNVGRRIDQTTPLADARLADGSRVNVIAPPLSLRGTAISIRKFSKMPITLDMMAEGGSLSPSMATVLKIVAACRLNVMISGGTGSGKTTMLNAMSKLIDTNERIVTIEDAAELQLQQPHVLSLETRPKNLEGAGEISMRDLVINSLRMRPDRIILGEVRGPEIVDMLQAMNTGHDGSLATVHANNPREAMTRMENMMNMANLNLPHTAIRHQIAESIDMIVQVERMKDGKRRVTAIEEVVGLEGDVVTMQNLFNFQYRERDDSGNIIGSFECTGIRPHMIDKAFNYDLDQQLMAAISEGVGRNSEGL